MGAVQQKVPSRDRIRNAARELFATNGFHQTSMSELAAAAEMSVGLIYRSFKSKEEIIEAIVIADFDEKLTELDDLRRRLDQGELTVLETFRELFLQVIDEGHEALSFDILAEGFRNERVGRTIGSMCEQFRDYLREFACAANRNLTGEELEGAVEMMLGCLFGLGHRSMSLPRLSAERTAEHSARMIVAALQSI
ncbi:MULTISPECIES: TetR/AcrR family transcriptional regulator [Novosphingobium]|uniref:TetR/AcrR family transcriptional regulator n=1 Tax=unclassified Novosphingobium TaxID=2644732 RepID=UPI0006C877B5|nr:MULTISPECIES: TetR/AcrR family transcriptional regulator [unclassified Novosphingobium]KPH58120.1 transcriptional regulator [Novosphingobium sp. ST904]MPS67994.1 TetR/AcrR family transcriptional regulator [Novosphingobium sp.]TCM41419.1 TetR family transcriptional regulator [Novosphingobium sp. ST904]